MPLRIDVVDAFTNTPFRGNPAAVCILPSGDWPNADWMQNVAREMNLSETAFLLPQSKHFALRWFTPRIEVALCGHATLASAHVLWQRELLAPDATARFQTQSGELHAWRAEDWIEMDFPAKPVESAHEPQGMLAALGLNAAQINFIGRNQFDYLLELESEKRVRDVKPNFAQLATIEARGVMITACGNGEFDMVSRFFAPAVGVDEDPVTGSAHCALVPYWSAKLRKRKLMAYQASARGGILRLRLDKERVILGGQAVTMLRGEFLHEDSGSLG